MKDVIDIFLQVILAIAGAVFFGSAAVAIGAVAVGCVVFGSCWSFLGWRKRRATRAKPQE